LLVAVRGQAVLAAKVVVTAKRKKHRNAIFSIAKIEAKSQGGAIERDSFHRAVERSILDARGFCQTFSH
jgi:hypothetical protein